MKQAKETAMKRETQFIRIKVTCSGKSYVVSSESVEYMRDVKFESTFAYGREKLGDIDDLRPTTPEGLVRALSMIEEAARANGDSSSGYKYELLPIQKLEIKHCMFSGRPLYLIS